MTTIMLKGIHKVKNKLAGGRVVEYHRIGRGKGAKRFWSSDDGTPVGGVDYMASYNAALTGSKPSVGKFRDTILAYLDSPEFKGLAERTQKDIRDSIYHKKGIYKEFGDMPISVFNDPRIRKRTLDWRKKKWDVTRQADMKIGHLRGIVTWAHNNGHVLEHHLKDIKKVYSSDRSGIIWTDKEIEDFCKPPVPEYARRVLIVVSETGLAPVDAVRLSREHIKDTPKGRRIEMRRAKTNKLASMPVTERMAEVLDAMPEGRGLVLTTAFGGAWKHENQLGKLVSKWRDEVGIRKERHLYDARGTAATRLLNAGLELNEIALAMGWSIDTAAKMIEVYAEVNPEITDAILEKLNSAKAA